jgi:ammonium transporter, Amt family
MRELSGAPAAAPAADTQATPIVYGIQGNYTTAVYSPTDATNAVWILTSAGFIFLMQAGFALVEAGAVTKKNRSAMLIKNLYNVAIAGIAFWLVGYGLGFGNPQYFVGNNQQFFASYGFEQVPQDNYLFWVIQFAYATVVVSIFQGALAERTQLWAYLIVSALLAGFIYPVILAWTWGQGWLNMKGFHDFAGTGIIHLVGGTVAFWGAVIVGERRAKIRAREDYVINIQVDVRNPDIQHELDDLHPDFSKIAKKHFKGNEGELARNNNAFIVLGTLLIWASYIFFVGGRTLGQSNNRSAASSKIIQNMFISSSFSALISALFKPIVMGTTNKRATKYDCLTLCNGALVGMIAISGAVDRVENWASVLIGVIAAVFYLGGVLLLEFYRIDDPLEVAPVHFAGGVWGLFAVGFFDNFSGALFTTSVQQGAFMGYQLVGAVVIIAFTSLVAGTAFLVMDKVDLLRIDKAIEEIGLDVAKLSPGVSEDFIDAVRDKIEARENQEKKRQRFADEEQERKVKVQLK